MTELYIKGQLIELGTTRISNFFQINDIGEPRDRQLNYTYPFNIPGTPKNLKILDMLGITGNKSRIPYEKVPARLVQNGVEIIPDGLIVFSSKDKKGFKAHIFSGNQYLYDKIGSKKLKDLNYTNLNHSVTIDLIKKSFNNKSGYIYAIADYGKIDVDNIEFNYQLPSLYIHTLWDMIFKEAGIKYDGDIFLTPKFRNRLLTMQRGYTREDKTGIPVSIESLSELTQQGYRTLHPDSSKKNYWYFIKEDVPTQPYVRNQDGTPVINVPSDDTYFFEADLKVFYDKNLWFNLYIEIWEVNDTLENGLFKKEVYSYRLQDYKAKPDPLGRSYLYFSDIKIKTSFFLKAKKNYVVAFVYQITRSVNGINYLHMTKISNFKIYNNKNFTYFNFQQYIGDLDQISFVKDIMQEFGLVFQKRKNELAYDFIQMNTMLRERSNVLDWSDKLVDEISESYTVKGYNRFNIFGYHYLTKDATKFADGILTVDNKNLPKEKKALTRPYNAPTISSKKINGEHLIYAKFWEEERDEKGKIEKYKPFKSKNYIADFKVINKGTYISFDKVSQKTYTNSLPILDFSKLHYEQLLEENYREVKAMLDSYLVKEVHIFLNEKDIQNLDFFKPIYLKQFASNFYINKIRYTNSNTVSVVEMVRINY